MKDWSDDKMVGVLQSMQVKPDQIKKVMERKAKRDREHKCADLIPHLCVTDPELTILEYVGRKDGKNDLREAMWKQGGESEESDDDYAWLDRLEKEDPDSYNNETYIAYTLESRTKFKKGEQVYTNYGASGNRHLFCNYGFTFVDNWNDCYYLQLRVDHNFDKQLVPSTEAILAASKNLARVQRCQLKVFQINLLLIAYLRSTLKPWFLETYPSVKPAQVLLTQAKFIELEHKVLERYQELIEHVLVEAE